MSHKQAHLEIIQGVVNRLSHNSFLLKGWSVVLVSAFIAVAANNSKPIFAILAFLPGIAFWALDGYFLRQEKLYRKIYNHVRVKEEDEIDYSMELSIVMDKVKPWHEVAITKTLLIFHGAIVVSIAAVMIYFIANPG